MWEGTWVPRENSCRLQKMCKSHTDRGPSQDWLFPPSLLQQNDVEWNNVTWGPAVVSQNTHTDRVPQCKLDSHYGTWGTRENNKWSVTKVNWFQQDRDICFTNCSFLGLENNSNFPKCIKDMQEAKIINQPDKANQLRSVWPAKEKPREVQAFSSVFWQGVLSKGLLIFLPFWDL